VSRICEQLDESVGAFGTRPLGHVAFPYVYLDATYLHRSFQGSAHQRCRVHFARNLLAQVPKSHADMVAAVFRTIFAQPDLEAVSKAWDEVRDQLAPSFPKVGPLMDEAKAEVLAFTAFPKAHWRKIWSTNPLERVNKEIKRRSRVVGIFPNAAAVIQLVGAVLTDMHDKWIAGDRRYLSEESMALLNNTMDTDAHTAIENGE
jgi:putative transposase